MLCDGLSHTIEHALQVVEFTALLDFYEDYPPLGVLRFDVHTVELGVFGFLI